MSQEKRALPKLARVVVLDFGEQNTYMTLCRCLKWECIESQMMLCQTQFDEHMILASLCVCVCVCVWCVCVCVCVCGGGGEGGSLGKKLCVCIEVVCLHRGDSLCMAVHGGT